MVLGGENEPTHKQEEAFDSMTEKSSATKITIFFLTWMVTNNRNNNNPPALFPISPSPFIINPHHSTRRIVEGCIPPPISRSESTRIKKQPISYY